MSNAEIMSSFSVFENMRICKVSKSIIDIVVKELLLGGGTSILLELIITDGSEENYEISIEQGEKFDATNWLFCLRYVIQIGFSYY